MKNGNTTVSRRHVLAGAAGVLAAPMVMRASYAAGKSESLTLVGWGGSYQEYMTESVTKPFTEETGIKVNIVAAPELAKIKAQQLVGNVEWDVYDNSGSAVTSGSKQGFWEKLDLSMFDIEDMAVPPTSEFVPICLYAGGIAWDPNKYGPGKHPTNFAEYFDLTKYPGRRSFFNGPGGTMEAALLADGVSPKDMYPLDVDRAFKVLDRIKPNIATWIDATPQSIIGLQTGEIDFGYTFANRVKATTVPGGGKPLAMSFEQNMIDTDCMAVLKGAPNKANGMKFLAYILRPEVQARFLNKLACPPVSKKAGPMLSADVKKWVPDTNSPKNLVIDNAYWADNLETVSRRFREWVMS